MDSPGSGIGPSKERDDTTGRNGSTGRTGGGGGGEREGSGGAGVLNSENNGRIRWQPSLIGRIR